MINHLVHEIAIVTHHNHASRKVLQILFQNLQGYDIQIVRRLVEHQEIGILHQHRTEIQFPSLTATQFIHIVVLLFWGKKEILQKL